jgi:hypothetical protein
MIAVLESDKVSETYTIYAHFGEKAGQFAATKYSVYSSLGFYPPEATSFLPESTSGYRSRKNSPGKDTGSPAG